MAPLTAQTVDAEWTVRRQPPSRNRLAYWLLLYKWRYAVGVGGIAVSSVLALLPPQILQRAVDDIAAGTSAERLLVFGALIVVVALFEGATAFAARMQIAGTSRRVEFGLREDLATRLMELDQRYYVDQRTGDLMARCTNDLQWVRDMVGPTFQNIARSTLLLAVALPWMLTIDVRLTLISIAYLPLIAVVVIYLETTMEEKFRRVQDQFGVLTNRAQENISGIRAVKAYAQEEHEIRSFGEDNREMMTRSMSYAYFSSAFFPVMVLATGAGTILVLWFGGHDVVSGRITLGQFVQFNAILVLLANQLIATGWVVTAYQQGTASLRRVNEVLRAVPAIADSSDPQRPERIRGDIEFHDVTFGYGAARVLDGVNLRIEAGSTVALVGETGAGKTTLVNLLVRLRDPSGGRVTIDGIDVRDLPIEQLRRAVGFVPQESFLFSDSLRENICLGRMDATDEELERALVTSQFSNDIDQFVDGLETAIGERGVTLSGGQRQRAALARALIKDPPMLVLDDALSHVDTHTEEEILRRLREFMRDRTTLIVAHRTSTLANAERVVVLGDGGIAEEGTHAELLSRGGIYARLYERQLLRERAESGGDGEAEPGSDGVAADEDGAR